MTFVPRREGNSIRSRCIRYCRHRLRHEGCETYRISSSSFIPHSLRDNEKLTRNEAIGCSGLLRPL
jgi:hypothetical protein